MNSGLNIGDVIFQSVALLIPILFVGIIVYFIRFSRRKAKHLERIEEKLDRLLEKK